MKKGVTSIGLLVMLFGLLVGCGGGSGEVGDDYRRISESGSAFLGSVLTFKSPESF